MNFFSGLGIPRTDSELVTNYLRPKVAGRPTLVNGAEAVLELDLCKHEPSDLKGKSSLLAGSDTECYFFTTLKKKHTNGTRINRATNAGYWKNPGIDVPVKENGETVGKKKRLAFYRGRHPKGTLTNFRIDEYQLLDETNSSQDTLVLCKLTKTRPRRVSDGDPQTDVDDDIDSGPGKQFLEPGSTSASALVPTPEETTNAARIDKSPDSESKFYVGGDRDDYAFWANVPSLSLATLGFDLPALEDAEDSSEPAGTSDNAAEFPSGVVGEDSSEPAGTSANAAEFPSGVVGKSDMSSKVQQIQQKEEV